MLESNASLQHLTDMILGIESTAHTLSFGLVDEDGITRPSVSDLFKPNEGEYTLVRPLITTLMWPVIC